MFSPLPAAGQGQWALQRRHSREERRPVVAAGAWRRSRGRPRTPRATSCAARRRPRLPFPSLLRTGVRRRALSLGSDGAGGDTGADGFGRASGLRSASIASVSSIGSASAFDPLASSLDNSRSLAARWGARPTPNPSLQWRLGGVRRDVMAVGVTRATAA